MVGKRRNPADNALPPRVYRGRKNYEFHPPGGGSILLCSLDSPLPVLWAKYAQVNARKADKKTMAALVAEFFESSYFTRLAADTQKDYKKNSRRLLPVFGKMDPDNVKPQHIRKYMDKRGATSEVQANREKSFLSGVYRWAYERGKVAGNPCTGVKKFMEIPRDRLITDAEYNAVYAEAREIVKIAMEISYLCLARQSDVLSLREAQLLEEGIFICQNKTKKKQIKAWSDRLRLVIAMSRALPLKPGIVSTFVIHQPNGNRYTRDGFNSAWRDAKLAAEEKFPDLNFDFTFHDIKAKGVSDLEGTLSEKQSISGHKTQSQTATYDRKVQIVPVVGNQ
ncbi:tyrosine-type recombinase/integrase [Pantoea sp. BAV 3049]|uniref:tyrosine-type recombinase/integrase n=1 Tax=Pantoea sp. BAV 3049 TaxID=2654188 RepID=UPI00131E49CB|nr:tyrosine-type recombinase/integrase [Pantoea sp. BAV 3049]